MFNKKQKKIEELERANSLLKVELERSRVRVEWACKDIDRLQLQNKTLIEAITKYLKIAGIKLSDNQKIKIPYHHDITPNDGHGILETFKIPELVISVYNNDAY